MTRVVSGKELATVILSKGFKTGAKCDEDNEDMKTQRGADLELEDRRSGDFTGKGSGVSTVDVVQGTGISKRKPKRQRRY